MAIWRREIKTEPAAQSGEAVEKTEEIRNEDLQKGEELSQKEAAAQEPGTSEHFRRDNVWRDGFGQKGDLPRETGKKEISGREDARTDDYGWNDDSRRRGSREQSYRKKEEIRRGDFLTIEVPEEPVLKENREETPLEPASQERPAPAESQEDSVQSAVSPEEYARFAEMASKRKKHRKKEVVAIRISPETLALARATGKGYTGFLSRLLDEAIRDPEMVKRCL